MKLLPAQIAVLEFTPEGRVKLIIMLGVLMVIVIAGFGPRAAGMPELFRISEIIAVNDALARTTAIITDGRYSGCTRGPAIGYVCPEALEGGAIGLVRDDDLIRIDITGRRLCLIQGRHEGIMRTGDELIALRQVDPQRFIRPELPIEGALAVYRRLARPGLLGGNMVCARER